MSSASSTIESTIGERFPLPPKGKTKRYKYGLVICIFLACVYVYVILLTFVGPEYRGRKFGVADDGDMAEAAGREAVDAVLLGEREERREKGETLIEEAV